MTKLVLCMEITFEGNIPVMRRNPKRSHHIKAKKQAEAPAVISPVVPAAVPRPARWLHAVIALSIGLFSIVMYAWTADFPMVFDDCMYIKDNPIFRNASNFSYPLHFNEFANLPAKQGIDPDYAVNFILRPVAYATFYANYLIDGFNPRWYRVVNIIVHACNAVLVYALMHLLLTHAIGGGMRRSSRLFIAITAAALFAAHPLATESVTYIVQRFTSMAAFFYLLALWLYFLSITRVSHTVLLKACAVLVMILGMLTKECSVTAPIMAVLLDSIIFGTALRLAAWRALPLLLCLPIIPGLVMLTSAAQHDGVLDLQTSLNIVNARDTPIAHWHYLVTQVTVVAAYLQRLFWPTGLNLDPEWPLYQSLLEQPVLAALGGLLALLAGAWWLQRHFHQDVHFKVCWAFLVWFFGTIFISSGLVPLPDLMAEHRSYLPSIGILVLTACLLDRARLFLRTSKWLKAIPTSIAILMLVGLSWATVKRNEVWSSDERLWLDTVAKSPGKCRVWGNLGAAYAGLEKHKEAADCFRKSIEIEPRFQNGAFNLSNTLLRIGQPQESVLVTRSLLEQGGNTAKDPTVLYTLALGLSQTGKVAEAIHTLHQCVETAPTYPNSHLLLGLIYIEQRKPQIALKHLHQAAILKSPHPELPVWIKKLEDQLIQSVSSN